MEKLEIKHLAPYLPYGLKYLYMKKEDIVWGDTSKDCIHTLVSYSEVGYHSKSDVGVTMFYEGELKEWQKPILRPLTDLTKEEAIVNVFKHEGIEMDTDENGGIRFFLDGETVWCKCDQLYYYVTALMIELHFDVFGLIEKGLAIDINTINN